MNYFLSLSTVEVYMTIYYILLDYNVFSRSFNIYISTRNLRRRIYSYFYTVVADCIEAERRKVEAESILAVVEIVLLEELGGIAPAVPYSSSSYRRRWRRTWRVSQPAPLGIRIRREGRSPPAAGAHPDH
jgi:hypothetical protein